MKRSKMALLALGCWLLTACGTNGSDASETEQAKPKLEVRVETSGTTATIHLDTDIHISKEHYGHGRVKGEGHFHMYLDGGEKVGVTEAIYEFPDLASGSHELKISLHNNDHTPYDVTKTVTFGIP